MTWQTAGGDYDSDFVTTTSVSGLGVVEFPSTPEFVALVQSWLDMPDENFGLVLVGDESDNPTAKRIDSREGVEANRPRLIVKLATPTATEKSELPSFLTALSTYPNPASDAATVRYELRESREVRIDILDVTGRLVATPVLGLRPAGSHTTRIGAEDFSPGLYLIRLISGGQSAARVMVLQ